MKKNAVILIITIILCVGLVTTHKQQKIVSYAASSSLKALYIQTEHGKAILGTVDGKIIYYDSATFQLYDNLRSPLYSELNGLPLYVNSNSNVATINGTEHKGYTVGGPVTFSGENILSATLNSVKSIGNRTGYYMAYAKLIYGDFDVVVFNIGTTKTPIWVLPNNASATAYIQDITIGGENGEDNWFDQYGAILIVGIIAIGVGLVIFSQAKKRKKQQINNTHNELPILKTLRESSEKTNSTVNYCVNCGTSLSADSRFCPNCGNRKTGY